VGREIDQLGGYSVSLAPNANPCDWGLATPSRRGTRRTLASDKSSNSRLCSSVRFRANWRRHKIPHASAGLVRPRPTTIKHKKVRKLTEGC